MTKCRGKGARKQGQKREAMGEESVEFTFGAGRKVAMDFEADWLTTDAGLAALRQVDDRFGLTRMAAERITDHRWQPMVVHSMERLLREEVYAYAAGYEDANDHTPLRNDPWYRRLVGPIQRGSINPKKQAGLASEPTLSRLVKMQRLTLGTEFSLVHVDQFAQVLGKKGPGFLTLDIDGFDAETFGEQQLTLFNGHFKQNMYYPLHVSAAEYGWVLGLKNRPGNAGAGTGAAEMLTPILRRLRAIWPKLRIRVRGDSGFALPEMYEACEADSDEYVFRLHWNEVLDRLMKKEMSARWRNGLPDGWEDGKAVMYGEAMYRAESWSRARRVVFKWTYDLETDEEEHFALVTNLRKAPPKTWTAYSHRGQEEQRIEEFKNDLRGEKLSCNELESNDFKLQLKGMTHNLFGAVRIGLPETHELKHATIGRLRLVLVKCGAMVKRTARQIWLHASRHFPYRRHVADVCRMALDPRWRSTPLWTSG
jgi:hypothetical protein